MAGRDLRGVHPILEQALQNHQLQRIVISTDDTRVWRTGKHVPQTQWHRDPMGPAFQAYFDRWGIEVNHRDEKDILGVGQAQVWNKDSVSKVPALLVAMYSWLQ